MSSDPITTLPVPRRRGLLFVVSAPSGTGKTTLVRRVVGLTPALEISRSYTCRPPRAGEEDGVDYHFVSRGHFEAMRESGGFLEWAEIYGDLYGTGAVETERLLAAGLDLVLVIDVQGARQVRASGVPVVTVFVLPPSFEVLEGRLRGRSSEPEERIQRRLEVARREVEASGDYDYVVVNDEIDASVARLRGIVLAERARLRVARAEIEPIVQGFRTGAKT
jgi:guanylate kinase